MAGLIQLALDLLGLGLPPATAEPAVPRRTPRPAGPPPPPRKRSRVLAPQPSGTLESPPLPRHPLANREALLLGRAVAYRLERGRRRTIGFVVDAEGLSVRAPAAAPLYQIDAVLAEKAAWILRKLAEAHLRHQRLEATRIAWRDGAEFPLRGEPTVLRLGAGRGDAGLKSDPQTGGQALWLALPADAHADRIGEAVRAWIWREARADFTERLDHHAARMGVRWSRLSVTDARTRWGSASIGGAIRLHWRLMLFRPDVIDYVVVHELAHLRHMDHSPRFWAVVAMQLPDYEKLRAELRADQQPRW